MPTCLCQLLLPIANRLSEIPSPYQMWVPPPSLCNPTCSHSRLGDTKGLLYGVKLGKEGRGTRVLQLLLLFRGWLQALESHTCHKMTEAAQTWWFAKKAVVASAGTGWVGQQASPPFDCHALIAFQVKGGGIPTDCALSLCQAEGLHWMPLLVLHLHQSSR